MLLYKNKYQDWNFQHFKDFLEKDENIKVSYNFILLYQTTHYFFARKVYKYIFSNISRVFICLI